MSNRDRGILTPRDREYLLGEREDDITGDYERRVRNEIRDRIFNALLDFWILAMYLDDAEFEHIFDEDRGKQSQVENQKQRGFPPTWYTLVHEEYRAPIFGQERGDQDEADPATTIFEESFKDAISFLYRGSEELPGVDFERVVEEGLTKRLREYGKTATVEITIRSVDHDVLLEKLQEGELNREEIPLYLDMDQ